MEHDPYGDLPWRHGRLRAFAHTNRDVNWWMVLFAFTGPLLLALALAVVWRVVAAPEGVPLSPPLAEHQQFNAMVDPQTGGGVLNWDDKLGRVVRRSGKLPDTANTGRHGVWNPKTQQVDWD